MFNHRQFSTHSSCYKVGNNYGEIADTDSERGGGRVGEAGQEKGGRGRVFWATEGKIKEGVA